MKQNLHTHSTYCDGKSTIKEMISSALHKGFSVLGFSSHSYTKFDPSYCMSEDDTLDYLDELCDAKKIFLNEPDAAKYYFAPDLEDAKKLRIYIGIEQDLYSYRPALRKSAGLMNHGYRYGTFDYIIGSTHALRLGRKELEERGISLDALELPYMNGIVRTYEGLYIYVDYGPEVLRWASENIFGGNPLALAENYFRDESRIVKDTDCDIVGHFDLLLKFNEKDPLFDEAAPEYRASRNAALDCIFSDFRELDREPVFEVNTGAMARGYRTVPYPSPDTLREIRDRGGRLLINSDCHQAEMLDYAFDEARDYVMKAGYKPLLMDVPGGKLEIFI